jgi:hypothetical protein
MANVMKLVPLLGARSEVWKHFGFKVDLNGVILNKKEVFCRNCSNAIKFNGNTTNLNSHLHMCKKK